MAIHIPKAVFPARVIIQATTGQLHNTTLLLTTLTNSGESILLQLIVTVFPTERSTTQIISLQTQTSLGRDSAMFLQAALLRLTLLIW